MLPDRQAGSALKSIGWTPADDAQLVALAVALDDWKAVVDRGDAVIEALSPLLARGSDRAVEVLGRIASPRAMQALLEVGKMGKAAEKAWKEAFRRAYQRSGSMEFLLQALKTQKLNVCHVLKRLEPPTLRIQALLCVLKNGDSEVREVIQQLGELDSAALEKLGEDGQKVVPTLVKHLPEFPADVAGALGRLGDARAIEPLAKWLMRPQAQHKEQMAAALHALGWRPETAAERAWLAAYRNDWPALAAQAEIGVHVLIERLSGFSDHWLADVIKASGPGAASYVDHFIKLLREAETPPTERIIKLAELLANETQHPELLWLAAVAQEFDFRFRDLAKMGESIVPFLEEGMHHANPKIRQACIASLGATGTASAIGPLVHALAEPDYEIQGPALEALDEIGTLEAVECIVAVLPSIHEYLISRAMVILSRFVGKNQERTPAALAFALLDMVSRGLGGSHEIRCEALGVLTRLKLANASDAAAMVDRLVQMTEYEGELGAIAAGALLGRLQPEHLPTLIQVIIKRKGAEVWQHVERIREILSSDAGSSVPVDVLQSILALEDRYTYTYSCSYWGSPSGRESDEQSITESHERCTECVAIKRLADARLQQRGPLRGSKS